MSCSLGPGPVSATVPAKMAWPARTRGMMASTGNPVAAWMSSSFSILRWNHSTAAGTPAPKQSDTPSEPRRIIIRLGLATGTGCDGGSMTFTTFISACSRMRAAASLSDSSACKLRWLSTSRVRRAYSASPPDRPFRLCRSDSACLRRASSRAAVE